MEVSACLRPLVWLTPLLAFALASCAPATRANMSSVLAPHTFSVNEGVNLPRDRGGHAAGNVDGCVVVASDADNAFAFLGRAKGARPPFSEAQRIVLPKAPYGAGGPVIVADFNGDGDPDIILNTAYGYSGFYEHSFIQSGYARGTAVAVEQKDRQ
jgi:hypothetical protein